MKETTERNLIFVINHRINNCSSIEDSLPKKYHSKLSKLNLTLMKKRLNLKLNRKIKHTLTVGKHDSIRVVALFLL